jgi:hypothetical protein
MLDVLRNTLSVLVFVVGTLTPGQADARQVLDRIQIQDRPVVRRQIPRDGKTDRLPFVRSELYFGTAMPDGVVTEEQFTQFIDEHVTPRFPDGLTLLKADGQFRGEDGTVIKERSFVLVLLYPYDTFADGSQRIERIRTLYKRQFNQQSVLRVDDPFVVWVMF